MSSARYARATLAGAVPAVAAAQAGDPAATTVAGLNAALLSSMRSGGGAEARAKKLQPSVDAAFDFPAMTRFAVGPSWAMIAPGDQAALTRAFARFSAATYAHNFDGYAGERFTIDPTVQTRGPDKLVRSQLVPKQGEPTGFTYRLRQSGGSWKIIDVFFNNTISELASQRADFQSTLSQGGAPALVRKLDEKIATLQR